MSEKKPKLNVRLLRRIKRHLIAEPRRYEQSVYGNTVEGKKAPACGTEGCIAGWAVFLSTPKSQWQTWIEEKYFRMKAKATELLGLDKSEANDLFSDANQKYNRGKLGVRAACKKIDALIESRKTARG